MSTATYDLEFDRWLTDDPERELLAVLADLQNRLGPRVYAGRMSPEAFQELCDQIDFSAEELADDPGDIIYGVEWVIAEPPDGSGVVKGHWTSPDNVKITITWSGTDIAELKVSCPDGLTEELWEKTINWLIEQNVIPDPEEPNPDPEHPAPPAAD